MFINSEIENFCSERAAKTVMMEMDKESVTVTELLDDMRHEYAIMINNFYDAIFYCTECFGTNANHYLSCSVWGTGFPFERVVSEA